jgi:DinB superfamily
MKPEKNLREYLRRVQTWHDAHADLKAVVKNLPVKLRGKRPVGAPHSPWELLEHMRLATRDILEFSRNPRHQSPDWPSGYWPKAPAPPNAGAWNKSAKALERDLKAMGKLVTNAKTDLFAPLAHSSGQTILREALLLADHNAYHLGQLVLVRRLLGSWTQD